MPEANTENQNRHADTLFTVTHSLQIERHPMQPAAVIGAPARHCYQSPVPREGCAALSVDVRLRFIS